MVTFENLTSSLRKRRDRVTYYRSTAGRLFVAVPNVICAAIRENLVPEGQRHLDTLVRPTLQLRALGESSSKSASGYCSKNFALLSS